MSDYSIFLIAFFLPLFPLSIVFNRLYSKVRNSYLRGTLLVVWPLIGIYLYQALEPQVQDWVLIWSLATSFLYAFRLIAMREVGIWSGYFATSVWACLWLPLAAGDVNVIFYTFWFGIPLFVLSLLTGGLESRFGAAYTNLYGGLARTIPRFSGVFVITILALTATPVFPAFLVMINMMIAIPPVMVVSLLCIWGLWSWAGMRLIQGLIVGESVDKPVPDLALSHVWSFAVLIVLLIFAGFKLTGSF